LLVTQFGQYKCMKKKCFLIFNSPSLAAVGPNWEGLTKKKLVEKYGKGGRYIVCLHKNWVYLRIIFFIFQLAASSFKKITNSPGNTWTYLPNILTRESRKRMYRFFCFSERFFLFCRVLSKRTYFFCVGII